MLFQYLSKWSKLRPFPTILEAKNKCIVRYIQFRVRNEFAGRLGDVSTSSKRRFDFEIYFSKKYEKCYQISTKNHISLSLSSRAQLYQPRIDEYLILVPIMVPYFVTEMGNLQNRELSCDRKLTKIGKFSPFKVSEIVFKCENQILHQKIHKNRWVKLFLTCFRSCYSLGQCSAFSHFRGRSFITLQQGGG